MQLDEKDHRLLRMLTDNARLPVSTIALTLGLARTTVQARLERLERGGVIAGYTLRTGSQLQPRLRATALVGIEPRSTPAVLDRLRSLKGVELVHTTSGRFDLMVQIAAVAPNMAPKGSKLLNIAPNCFKLLKISQNSSKYL